MIASTFPLRLCVAWLLSAPLWCADAWVLPEPASFGEPATFPWMAEPAPPGTLRIGSVDDGPGQWAGWTEGDRILELAGYRPFSTSEMCLLRNLADAQVDALSVRTSGGAPQRSFLVGLSIYGGTRLGVDDMELVGEQPLPADLVPSFPIGMPARVRAEVGHALAQAPRADRGWWRCLAETWLAGRNRTPPPPAVPQPRPFLAAVLERWRAVALTPADELPPAPAGLEQAVFQTLYDPFPEADADLGTPGLLPEVDEALAKYRRGELSKEELAQRGRVLGSNIPVATPEAYARLVCVAIMDPDSNGGWPVRMELVTDRTKRTQLVAELARLERAEGAHPLYYVLAEVAPAAMDLRWADLERHLRALAGGSPWLAVHGIAIAGMAAQWYGGEQDLRALVGRLVPLFSGSTRRLVRLVAAGRLPADRIADSPMRADEFTNPLRYGGYSVPTADEQARAVSASPKLGPGLMLLARQAVSEAACVDPEGAWWYAQQAMRAPFRLKADDADALALIAARTGRFELAAAWENAACHRMGRNQAKLAEARKRLDLYRQSQVPAVVSEDAGSEAARAGDGMTFRGRETGGAAEGRWIAIDAAGRTRVEAWFHRDEPAGRYRLSGADGQEVAVGSVLNGARIGLFRMAAGTGRAEGWYDGDEDGHGGRRTGWWRVCDAQGRTVAAGCCVKGVAIGVWRDAAGARIADPGRLLPADPPLPSFDRAAPF